METNKANDYLMQKLIRKEAMKNVCSSYSLTDEYMEEHFMELDWTRVSGNNNIHWTAARIESWQMSLDWKEFSRSANESVLIPEVIEIFKDRWDWSELSDNSDLKLSFELIDKYIDRWDWNKIINRGRWGDPDEIFSKDFFNRYAEHIPMENLENSSLWEAIIEEETDLIKKDIMLKKQQK